MTDIQQHQEYNKILIKMAKEQLMEDIDCIITEYFQGIDDAELNQVTEILCDAVCKNFPAN